MTKLIPLLFSVLLLTSATSLQLASAHAATWDSAPLPTVRRPDLRTGSRPGRVTLEPQPVTEQPVTEPETREPSLIRPYVVAAEKERRAREEAEHAHRQAEYTRVEAAYHDEKARREAHQTAELERAQQERRVRLLMDEDPYNEPLHGAPAYA